MSAAAPVRVLLVEDDTGIGRMLERSLQSEGYAVDWARDLKGAIEAARGTLYDLVLLDRTLPDGDGAEFCRALRRFGSQAPICMLTAREALEDKLEGFDAGADDYVTKPFELDELLARLAALRRRSGRIVHSAVLSPERRALRYGPQQVFFTGREWPILALLFAHEGEPVSRERLIAEAWQSEGEVTPNSVDVYIGYIRRKLSGAGIPLRIETVRAVGFVLKQ
ncbi:MAG: response regulator transcription factor [Pseudomonadota bacterium]